MTIELSAAALLAAMCGLLLAAVILQASGLRRARAREQALRRDIDALRADVGLLQQDLGALCSGANGVGSHLTRVDRQLLRLNERQDQIELRYTSHFEYDQAVRLVRSGAGIEEIMSKCSLARAEAELLLQLHIPDSRMDRARAGMRSVA